MAVQQNTTYFYNQLEELAHARQLYETSRPSASGRGGCNSSEEDEEEDGPTVMAVPDQSCREPVPEDHPFLKYAVKLGYELPLAQDALARLGGAASTDSLLKAVLYSHAALHPSRRSRHNRRYNGNRTYQNNGYHGNGYQSNGNGYHSNGNHSNGNHSNGNHSNGNHSNGYNSYRPQLLGGSPHGTTLANGRPFPSYMTTQDCYQKSNGHNPDVTALKSVLHQVPGTPLHQVKAISPPGRLPDQHSAPQTESDEELNVNAMPFQPFAYSLDHTGSRRR